MADDLRAALALRECPVDGCNRDPGTAWICERCWRLIPTQARRDINAMDFDSPEWWDWAAQCVAIVEMREARQH